MAEGDHELGRIDADAIRSSNLITDIATRYGVRLSRDGKEWRTCCPFHKEDTPSFTIFADRRGTQRFHCFGCGAHGDVIDFVMEWEGVEFREAAEILGGDREPTKDASRAVKVAAPADVYAGLEACPRPDWEDAPTPASPVTVFNPKRRTRVTYTPSLVHCYHAGAYVIRVDIGDRKITPTIMWVRGPCLDGSAWEGWAHFPMPEPRPLYRLADLRARPDAQILIVEGEKCADVAAAILPGLVSVTWCGGAGAVGKSDWSPLAGRRVVIWPDNDDPGATAAVDVAEAALRAGATSVRIIRRPGPDKPKGWDIADAVAEGWTAAQIVEFARTRARDWTLADTVRWGSDVESAPRTRPVTSPRQRAAHAGGDISLKEVMRNTEYPRAGAESVQGISGPFPRGNTQPRSAPSTRGGAVPSIPLDRRDNVTALPGVTIPAAESLENWRGNLILNEDGIVRPRLSQNFKWMLRCHADTSGLFAWNEISEAVFLHRAPPWGGPYPATFAARRLTNNDIFETTTWLERRGLTPRKNETADTIYDVASFHSYNPVRSYLNALKWDGCPRLAGGAWSGETVDPLSVEYLGTPPDPIYGVFMVKWHIAAIARIMRPGCQVDNMIVLESPQGQRKSSYVRAMSTVAGVEYFCDDVGDISNKDSIIRLHGCWLVEIAELAKVRHADIEVTKSWVTRRSDRYRPPYEREVKDVPRHFVLAASVNPSGYGYLRDPTGNRRFWPVPIREIDVDRIAADRDQIWAEAVHYYRLGMKHWATRDEELRVDELTGDRRSEDPWGEKINRWLADPEQVHGLMNGGITLDAVIAGIGIPVGQQNEWTAKRVAEHLKEAGLMRARDGKKRVWRRSADVGTDVTDIDPEPFTV